VRPNLGTISFLGKFRSMPGSKGTASVAGMISFFGHVPFFWDVPFLGRSFFRVVPFFGRFLFWEMDGTFRNFRSRGNAKFSDFSLNLDRRCSQRYRIRKFRNVRTKNDVIGWIAEF
jgi:hypothetical protein